MAEARYDDLRLLGVARSDARDGYGQAVLDALADQTAVVDADGTIVMVNLAWERFAVANGGDERACGVGSDYLAACGATTGPEAEVARRVAEGVRAVIDGRQPAFSLVYPCHSPTQDRWFRVRAVPFRDGCRAAVVSHADVTRAQQDGARRREAEQRFELAFTCAPIGMALVDLVGCFVQVNPKLCDILGREEANLVGTDTGALIHPGDVGADVDRRTELFAGGTRSYVVEKRFLRPDGRVVWASVSVALAWSDDGEPLHFVEQVQDVTERREVEARLAHQAMHDGLTGLPNRALFLDRLRGGLARAARRGRRVAVLFADLDHFKVVNDSLGHDAGDRLLFEVAERLCAAVRPGDTVARFGGDEFVVLCEDVGGPEEAGTIAERLAGALRAPFDLGGWPATVSASIGVTLAPAAADAGQGAEALLRDADTAMYQAKERGRDRHELFDDGLRARAVARQELEAELRFAITAGQLDVFYQPEVDLRQGRVVGVEALVRWRHPERGLVPPGDFIPLAEETGLIVPLGSWVLERACRQLAEWSATDPTCDLVLSVNLSARQIARSDVVQMVRSHLAATGVDPSRLCLEITETAFTEATESVCRALGELRALGVTLALDDFGTGHSSLATLKRLPVDVVKLDRAFVDGLGTDASDGAIVEAVTTLARALGLTTVAEGVERAEQLEQVRALRCDVAQGYYLATPQPAGTLADLIAGTVLPAAGTRVLRTSPAAPGGGPNAVLVAAGTRVLRTSPAAPGGDPDPAGSVRPE